MSTQNPGEVVDYFGWKREYETEPMSSEHNKPRVGEQVILLALPPGFLAGLPEEDQRAITAMVGRPVMVVGYDDRGSVELHFEDPFESPTNKSSLSHSIWVGPDCIGRIRA